MADIFDALYSDRPYRTRMSILEIKELFSQDVEQGCLDESVVKLLFELIDSGEIEKIF